MKFTCTQCGADHAVSLRQVCEPGEFVEAVITTKDCPPEAIAIGEFIALMAKTLEDFAASTGCAAKAYVDKLETAGESTTIRLMLATTRKDKQT